MLSQRTRSLAVVSNSFPKIAMGVEVPGPGLDDPPCTKIHRRLPVARRGTIGSTARLRIPTLGGPSDCCILPAEP